mmetsp:Transcript_7359/g.11714  ORF Transcript_7359/g.11714 Transcript_7359/m.11714 type:complete len:98 (-) Transcript_7359:146-439(-)
MVVLQMYAHTESVSLCVLVRHCNVCRRDCARDGHPAHAFVCVCACVCVCIICVLRVYLACTYLCVGETVADARDQQLRAETLDPTLPSIRTNYRIMG